MKRGMVALGVAAAAAVAALWWLPMQRPYEGRIQAILEVEGVAAADMARPAVLEVRRGNTVQVRQPVTLSLGSTTFPVGRGSADTSLWDRIELKEVGAGPPLKVKMTVRAGHGAAMVQGDLSEASSLVLERPGTEFEGYLRRWRLRVPVLAGLIGGLVFLAFKSSRAGHAARVALVVIAGVVLLRLFKPENVQERDQWWVVLASDLLIAGAAA